MTEMTECFALERSDGEEDFPLLGINGIEIFPSSQREETIWSEDGFSPWENSSDELIPSVVQIQDHHENPVDEEQDEWNNGILKKRKRVRKFTTPKKMRVIDSKLDDKNTPYAFERGLEDDDMDDHNYFEKPIFEYEPFNSPSSHPPHLVTNKSSHEDHKLPPPPPPPNTDGMRYSNGPIFEDGKVLIPKPPQHSDQQVSVPIGTNNFMEQRDINPYGPFSGNLYNQDSLERATSRPQTVHSSLTGYDSLPHSPKDVYQPLSTEPKSMFVEFDSVAGRRDLEKIFAKENEFHDIRLYTLRVFYCLLTGHLESQVNNTDCDIHLLIEKLLGVDESLRHINEKTFVREIHLKVQTGEIVKVKKHKPERYHGKTFSKYMKKRSGGSGGIFLNNSISLVSYYIDAIFSHYFELRGGINIKRNQYRVGRKGHTDPNLKKNILQPLFNFFLNSMNPMNLQSVKNSSYHENFARLITELRIVLFRSDKRGKEGPKSKKKRVGMSTSEIRANTVGFNITFVRDWKESAQLLIDVCTKVNINTRSSLPINKIKKLMEKDPRLECVERIGECDLELLLRSLFGYRTLNTKKRPRDEELGVFKKAILKCVRTRKGGQGRKRRRKKRR